MLMLAAIIDALLTGIAIGLRLAKWANDGLLEEGSLVCVPELHQRACIPSARPHAGGPGPVDFSAIRRNWHAAGKAGGRA